MGLLFRTLLVLLVGSPLSAAILFFSGYDPARSSVVTFQVDGQEETTTAGVMLIQLDGSWNADAFCADLFTGIASGQSYSSNVSQPGAGVMPRIAWLLANVLPGVQPGAANAPLQGAALQLAVWDIIHDNGDGLGAGRVQMSSNTDANVASYVNGYLAAPWSPTPGAGLFENAFIPSNIAAQNLVALVPEPSPGSLAIYGLGLIWLARRMNPAPAR